MKAPRGRVGTAAAALASGSLLVFAVPARVIGDGYEGYMQRMDRKRTTSRFAASQPAVLRHLNEFADRHPLPGSALQGLCWGLFMFVPLAVIRPDDLAFVAVLCGVGAALIGTCLYPFHRWKRRQLLGDRQSVDGT